MPQAGPMQMITSGGAANIQSGHRQWAEAMGCQAPCVYIYVYPFLYYIYYLVYLGLYFTFFRNCYFDKNGV